MKSTMKKLLLWTIALAVFMSANVSNSIASGNGGDASIQIVGGQDANINDYPWQVALFGIDSEGNITEFICGGSIIDPYWILTAAHCVQENAHKTQKIVASISNVSLASAGQIIEISDYIIHEGFDMENKGYDIALLRLATPIDTTVTGAAVIRMITPDDEVAGLINPGVMATISGWGTTEYMGDSPDRLQVGVLPIISIETANQWFEESEPFEELIVEEDMLPAGYEEGGVSGCHGDSGGPLAVKDNTNNWALAGVTSWGNICAGAKQPAVYSRVPYYHDWIMSNSDIGSTEQPIHDDYVEIVRLIVEDKVKACGDAVSIGDVLIRNFGKNLLQSFNLTISIGNSPEDIFYTDTETINFDTPLPTKSSKRIELNTVIPEEYGDFYLEVIVSMPNEENVQIANNKATKYIEFAEAMPMHIDFSFGNLMTATWLIVETGEFMPIKQVQYDASYKNSELSEIQCLDDGEYFFMFFSQGEANCSISFEYQGNRYKVYESSGGFSSSQFSFTVPFVPSYDAGIISGLYSDTIYVCDLLNMQGGLDISINNFGSMPLNNLEYKMTVNGTVIEDTLDEPVYSGNVVYLEVDNALLQNGHNTITVEILDYDGIELDEDPDDQYLNLNVYIYEIPKFAALEFRPDNMYFGFSWRILDSEGSLIQEENVYQQYPYSIDLCLAPGCYTFEPVSWNEIGMTSDTAVILRNLNGDIIFAIKGSDYLDSKPVEFCNTFSSVIDIAISDMNIYPNPAKSAIHVNIPSMMNADALITISDLLGNTIISKNVVLTNGNNLINFDVSSLSSGVYMVKAVSGTTVISKKLSVSK